MKICIFYIVLCLNIIYLNAEPKLKVLSANNGAISRSQSGASNKIKSGAFINYSDKIIISEKGYLVVQCDNGKPLELKKSGEYLCSALIDNCSNITSAGFKDFTDWVSSNMMKQKTDKGTMMKNLGAVSRMSSGSKKVNVPIRVSKILDSNFTLVWNSLKMKLGSPNGMGKDEKQAYIVKIFDNKGTQILTKETVDTVLDVNLMRPLIDTLSLYWQVEAKGYPRTISEISALVFTGIDEKNQIKEKIVSMNNEFEASDSPFANFLLANYFDSNGYYIDAYLQFRKAINMQDPPEEYVLRFKEFMDNQKEMP